MEEWFPIIAPLTFFFSFSIYTQNINRLSDGIKYINIFITHSTCPIHVFHTPTWIWKFCIQYHPLLYTQKIKKIIVSFTDFILYMTLCYKKFCKMKVNIGSMKPLKMMKMEKIISSKCGILCKFSLLFVLP